VPVPSRREALVRPAAVRPASPPVTEPAGAPALEPAKSRPARSASASSAGRPPRPPRGAHAWPKLDVAAASALVVLAFAASTSLPAGSLRLLLVLPMLLFAPGYLLLQAFVVPAAPPAARAWQALASLGISPAVLGLLALATSIVQGGFREDAILGLTALGSLAFAGAALVRRRALARAPTARPNEAPQAATAKTGPARP
jgi:hypothetical protein